MGAFKCNALAPCHRHFPWSGCLMARLSGFFTAFNISVSPSFKNNQFRFFSERFYTSADSFISKNEGMAEVLTSNGLSANDPQRTSSAAYHVQEMPKISDLFLWAAGSWSLSITSHHE